jgi:hypothetical protein
MLGPVVIIVVLVFLVAHVARKAPAVDPNAENRQALGPDLTIPATGQTTPISPAMGGGSPQMSGANQLRLMTNMKLTTANQSRVSLKVPAIAAGALTPDADMGPTQADSSLPTQNVKPTVGYKISGAGIVTNTSINVRKY